VKEALKIRPDNAEAHSSLLTALMQKGNASEATAHWQNSLELQPENVSACDSLGVAILP